jgi:hypothetical protein
LCRFQVRHLAESAQMSFGLTEFGSQKGLNEIPSHSRSYRSATHAKDVHMIVFDTLPGREMIVDQRSADAGNLVGTDRRTYPAAANCHGTIDLPRRHSLTERDNKVRVVVVQVQAVRAEIDNLMARRAELSDQLLLQAEPAVIGGDADAHVDPSSS